MRFTVIALVVIPLLLVGCASSRYETARLTPTSLSVPLGPPFEAVYLLNFLYTAPNSSSLQIKQPQEWVVMNPSLADQVYRTITTLPLTHPNPCLLDILPWGRGLLSRRPAYS